MLVRRIRWAALVIAFVFLIQVDRPAWAGGLHVAGATTPVQAVTILVTPFSSSQHNKACNALEGKLAACPITQRLRQRLQTAKENGNLICRCQNPPRWTRVWLYSRSGTTAHVEVMWDYGGTWYPMVFVTVMRHGGWLVDDQYCTARPSTTVYHTPAGPCR